LKDFSVSTKEQELEAWRLATVVMIVLAAAVFLVQRLAGPFLDLVFEFCIFYIPAFTIVGLFLYFRKKLR
jgi:antibiotic biosynthesis monooxygenase (ABM) superfamily enzyme